MWKLFYFTQTIFMQMLYKLRYCDKYLIFYAFIVHRH